MQESQQHLAADRRVGRFSHVKDKLDPNRYNPEFTESKLRKEDPLRIAKRKRVDYGDVFEKNPVEKKKNRLEILENELGDEPGPKAPFKFRKGMGTKVVVDLDQFK